MAKSLDSYNDLQELGIDCNDDDEVTKAFSKAADHLQTLLRNVDSVTLALLYGYYKQAIEGQCKAPKPSWFDVRAKHKWEAWTKLGDMDQKKAKIMYINTIQKIDPTFSVTSATKESWVTVSTLQSKDKILNDDEKSLVDYVKENNCGAVSKILKSYDNSVLETALTALDPEGLALIHWASDHGLVEMMQLLISFGVDINLRDSEKQTPLHYASSCGHVTCVPLLLQNGADVDAKDSDGETPLTVCSDEVVRDLLINHK